MNRQEIMGPSLNPIEDLRRLQRLAAEAQRQKRAEIDKERRRWRNMIDRCTNPASPQWKNYGGRGIRVYPAWRESFDAYLKDVGPCPAPGMSIDRIDNDGDYEPGNVRWATPREQSLNTRRTAEPARGSVLKIDGKWRAQVRLAATKTFKTKGEAEAWATHVAKAFRLETA